MTLNGGVTEPDQSNIATRLACLVESCGGFFFHSQGEPYVRIRNGPHSEIVPIRSRKFKMFLTRKSYEYDGKPAGSDATETAIRLVEAQALFEGPEIELNNRVGWYGKKIVFDLSNSEGQAVMIDTSGWSIDEAPVMFRRYKHQKKAVMPARSDIPLLERLEKIFDLVNHDPESRILHLVEIIFSFVPDVPHPIPVVFGEQGSAKSSFFKIWKALVDPSKVGTVAFPRKQEELIQKIDHHWFTPFDNVSSLYEWQSDALCRAVTGDGFSKRSLYTNDDDFIYSFKRVVGLNGINVAAEKPDLLDRSILHRFPSLPLTSRMTESELWSRFDGLAPLIMGAIFDTLSKALRILPTIETSGLYRMADFTRWGCAIAEALSIGSKRFLAEYAINQNVQNTEALETDPVGLVILDLWESFKAAGKLPYKAKPADAHKELTAIADNLGVLNDKKWPKSAGAMSRRLNIIKTNLRKHGIDFSSVTDGRRHWIFTPLEDSESIVSCVISSEQETLDAYDITIPTTLSENKEGDDSKVDKLAVHTAPLAEFEKAGA